MALTLDIGEVTRLRRAIDAGAPLLAVALFVEAWAFLAVVAKGDPLALGLAIPIGVDLAAQARIIRGGPVVSSVDDAEQLVRTHLPSVSVTSLTR